MKARKVLALILAMLSLVACLSACGKTQEKENSPDAPTNSDVPNAGDVALDVKDDSLVVDSYDSYRGEVITYTSKDTGFKKQTPEDTLVVWANGIKAVDPMQGQEEYPWSFNVYEPLWKINRTTGDLEPCLALEWGYTDDVTFEIKLRPNVKFHDGTIMDADDVLFSLQRNAKTTKSLAYGICNMIDFEKSYKVDDLNLVLVMKEPVGNLESALASGCACIMSKEFCEEKGEDFAFMDADAGSGAYYLVDTVTDEYHTFKAFDEWWGGTPKVGTIIAKFYSDMSIMCMDYENGNVDIAFENTSFNVERFLNGEITDSTLFSTENNRGQLMYLCCEEGTPFSDLRLRQAFVHCIDWNAYAQAIYGVKGKAPSSVLHAANKFYYDCGVYEYDVEKAKALLAECGYSTENPLKLEMVTSTWVDNADGATIMQEYCRIVGIELNITTGKASAMSTIQNSKSMEGMVDITMDMGLCFNGGEPDVLFSGKDAYGRAVGEYRPMFDFTDQKVSELIVAGRKEQDSEKRYEIYKELQQEIHDKVWMIPVSSYNGAIFARNYVQGITFESGYNIFWADLEIVE